MMSTYLPRRDFAKQVAPDAVNGSEGAPCVRQFGSGDFRVADSAVRQFVQKSNVPSQNTQEVSVEKYYGHLLALALEERGAAFLVAQLEGKGAATRPESLAEYATQTWIEIKPYLTTCCYSNNANSVVQCLIGKPHCRDDILRCLSRHLWNLVLDSNGYKVVVKLIETQHDQDLLSFLEEHNDDALRKLKTYCGFVAQLNTKLDTGSLQELKDYEARRLNLCGVCNVYQPAFHVYGLVHLEEVAESFCKQFVLGWHLYKRYTYCRSFMRTLRKVFASDGHHGHLLTQSKPALAKAPCRKGLESHPVM